MESAAEDYRPTALAGHLADGGEAVITRQKVIEREEWQRDRHGREERSGEERQKERQREK